jgi:cytochrome c oxidase subunit 1
VEKMATTKTSAPVVASRGIVSYMALTGLILFVMMIFGLIMLLNQGNIIQLSPALFYEILTTHGTFMIGVASLGGAAIMWYYLNQYVKLSKTVLILNLTFFLIGVVLVLVGIFGFHYAGAWTFLYPISSSSAGGWGKPGAVLYLLGMLILGIGFLIFYLDAARAIIKGYGSLTKGLGWDYIFGKKTGYGPPGTVVASSMATICNTTAIVVGGIAIVMNIVNVVNPSFSANALIIKELTYAFGHIFANVTIYMAVIAVYEILPRYTNRPWKSNKVFLIGWMLSTIFTLCIYTHHMYMDFAMPHWLLISGQIISYGNGLPVLVVTAYGALMLVWRSGIKWDIPSGFMFLSMFGWVIGVVPALVDATIVINSTMHNTRWVPGHFHMYMGLGVCAMLFGFMYYLIKADNRLKTNIIDEISFWTFTIAFLGLCATFLFGGEVGAPRRWAEHLPQWVPADQIGAVFAVVVILAVSTFIVRFFAYAFTMNVKQSKHHDMDHVKHA